MLRLLVIMVLLASPLLAQESTAPAVPSFFGERPDSAYLTLLRSLKHNRFEVHLVDGTEFKGRATVTDSGMALDNYVWHGGHIEESNRLFAPWRDIQSIRALKKESSWPGAAIAGAMGFLILVIYLGARAA
ncbi:hypothetical protein LLH00_17655 [bacterium]|nr:hypothetical protein [bacterium]